MMNISTTHAKDHFIKSLSGSNYSEKTITAYSKDVEQFIGWVGKTRIDWDNPRHFTRIDIVEYLNYLASQKESGVTRVRKLSSIRSYFSFLKENQIILGNPADTIKNPLKEEKDPQVLQKNEYKALLFEASRNPRDYALLQVFLQTGIRVGELVNLQLNDVDLENRTLVVHQGKGRRDRTIPLDVQAKEAITKYLQERNSLDSCHNLFVSRKCTGIAIRTVRQVVKKYMKRAGVNNKASVHTLRHTFGTHKIDKGMPIAALKEVLGHKKMETTYKYVHLAKSSLREHMERTGL